MVPTNWVQAYLTTLKFKEGLAFAPGVRRHRATAVWLNGPAAEDCPTAQNSDTPTSSRQVVRLRSVCLYIATVHLHLSSVLVYVISQISFESPNDPSL